MLQSQPTSTPASAGASTVSGASQKSDQPKSDQPKSGQWAAVRLVAIDVDGVLTDGSLTFDENGSLLQTYYVRDGFALVAARRAGLKIAWVSGRHSAVAQKRFYELGLDPDLCLLSIADKAATLRHLQKTYELKPEQCCFIGDDLPDLPAFAVCGVRVAVGDADEEIIARATYVTRARGGRGAVREVLEHILRAQGHWDALVEKFAVDDAAHGTIDNLQK